MRNMRGFLALALGLGITAAIALAILVAGPIGALVHVLSRGRIQNAIELCPKLWGYLIHTCCIKGLLNVNVQLTGAPFTQLNDDEVALVIGNHPSTAAIPSVLWYVTRHLRDRLFIVAKSDFLKNPILGWPARLINMALFIDRKNRIRAKRAIRIALKRRYSTDQAILVFPDQRRPWPDRIEADRRRFASTIPGLDQWLHHTMLPRSGGFATLLAALGDRPVRVFLLTTSYGIPERGVFDLNRLVGGTLHFHLEPCARPRFIRERDTQRWLNEQWMMVNRRIGEWRETSYSGGPDAA